MRGGVTPHTPLFQTSPSQPFGSAANPGNTYTNAGTYTVKLIALGATGSNSFTRTNYIVVTNSPPTITAQPQNQTVSVGSNATFSVTATGTAPLAYQWRRNAQNISGATASSYTRTNAQLADMGNYSVAFISI